MPDAPPPLDPDTASAVSRPTGRSWGRRLLATFGTGVAFALVVWFVVIPYPRGLGEGDPGNTALMEQRIRTARANGDSLVIRREWVPLDRISPNLRRAVVVAEDYRFREHEGIDWVSLAEEVEWTGDDDFSWWSREDLGALVTALRYVWENRSELRGRSTLTQQLAKNLYFGTDRSLVRKAMEAVVARRLERQLDKDRILELYLNIAEWGPGVFGAEAAAKTYFGRSAESLSLSQAATLAATLPHPLTSNLHTRPGRMVWRRDLILDRIDPTRGIPTIPMPLPPPDFGDEFSPSGEPVPVPPPTSELDSSAVSDTVADPDTVTGSDRSVPPDTTLEQDTVAPVDTTATSAWRQRAPG